MCMYGMCLCFKSRSRKLMIIKMPCLRWPQMTAVMMSTEVGPTSGVWSTAWVLSGNLISVTLTYNPGKCILKNTQTPTKHFSFRPLCGFASIWPVIIQYCPPSSSPNQWDCLERCRSPSTERLNLPHRDMTQLDQSPHRSTENTWMDERRCRSRRASGTNIYTTL